MNIIISKTIKGKVIHRIHTDQDNYFDHYHAEEKKYHNKSPSVFHSQNKKSPRKVTKWHKAKNLVLSYNKYVNRYKIQKKLGLVTEVDLRNKFLQHKQFFLQNEAILNPDYYKNEEVDIHNIDQDILNHELSLTVNYLQDVGLLKEMKRRDLYYGGSGVCEILSGYEKLNIDSPNGYEQYLEYFKNKIMEIKSMYQVQKKEEQPYCFVVLDDEDDNNKNKNIFNAADKMKELVNDINSDHRQTNSDDVVNYFSREVLDKSVGQEGVNKSLYKHENNLSPNKSQKNQNNPNQKQYNISPNKTINNFDSLKTHKKNPHLTINRKHKKTYYYFKRWLWLIFPNACLESGPHCNFSDFMGSCFSKAEKTISEQLNKQLENKCNTIVAEILIL